MPARSNEHKRVPRVPFCAGQPALEQYWPAELPETMLDGLAGGPVLMIKPIAPKNYPGANFEPSPYPQAWPNRGWGSPDDSVQSRLPGCSPAQVAQKLR